ncbi:MAG: DUF2752 domain-containing protein [Oscillospiraceae bacterium]|nr:DUF2752 domain-containing protein [Oscillospiraceae bacterium]
MQTESKKQQRRICFRRYLTALGILGLYALEIRLIGFRIPCPFHYVTGLRCPGCGITRMFLYMMKGDFRRSFQCNQVLFFVVPMLAAAAVVKLIWMPRFLTSESKFYRISSYVLLAVLLGFGVLRNIV